MEDKRHVIWWRYSDGSGCGVVAIYEHKEKADRDFKLLGEYGDNAKIFLLEEVEYVAE